MSRNKIDRLVKKFKDSFIRQIIQETGPTADNYNHKETDGGRSARMILVWIGASCFKDLEATKRKPTTSKDSKAVDK